MREPLAIAEALRRKANWIELHWDRLHELAGSTLIEDANWITLFDDDNNDVGQRLGAVAKFMRDRQGSAEWSKVETDWDRGARLAWGHGISFRVVVSRDAVCELVEVGTETVDVTETVVVGTEERPVYERRCEPLLALMDAER